MKLKINYGSHALQAALLERSVRERIDLGEGETLSVTLKTDPGMKPESYRVDAVPDGFEVTGADDLGLSFGIGKLLHYAVWTENSFAPKATRGAVEPAGAFRAIYFSIHFYNWYQNAPEEELKKYMEDLLLWGYNTIVLIIPVVNSFSIGDEIFARNADKAKSVCVLAKKLGMKTGIIVGPNQGTKDSPHEFDADLSYDPLSKRGHAGRNLCINKPGAAEFMKRIYRAELETFSGVGLDYILTWPYDEGGCGCEKCRPWGARGYLDAAKMIRECALPLFPDAKYIISTWFFDTPDTGEYEGLYERLKGDMSWVDAIMVDDPFGPTPEYVLTHDPVKPIVNFPEISMWKLFPWGGFGSNPMPERFDEFHRIGKKVVSGGMPYSEGIYEDVSKIQWVGYYWDPESDPKEILREYMAYETAPEVADEGLELLACLERNHVLTGNQISPDPEDSRRAGELARIIDGAIPEKRKKSWRWRVIYIRALLDEKRHAYYFSHSNGTTDDLWLLRYYSGVFLARDAEAQKLLTELTELYHSSLPNGENQWTLPPVGGTTIP